MMGHGYRSGAVRRLAQAADLPHLDLRLRERRRRQAPLRGHHRQASGRRRGPRLFALQRPQPGDTRGPARRLGGCRGRADLLLGHVGDRHPAARLRPARRRGRPFGAALRRDRDASSRRILGRFGVTWLDFPPARPSEEIAEVHRRSAKAQGGVALIYLESPANPTNALVDVEAVAPRARCRLPGDDAAADRDRQHLPRARSGSTRCATAPTCRSIRLTKYAGGHSTSSPAASSARRR